MNFRILLCGYLLFILRKGECHVVGTGANGQLVNEDLLAKITEKLNEWEKTIIKQPDVEKLIENIKNLQKNVESCNSKHEVEEIDGNESFRRRVNHLLSKFEILTKNLELNPVRGPQIKSLERKLSRLQYSLDRSLLRSGLAPLTPDGEQANEESKDLMLDVATKVDMLYNKLSTDDVLGSDNAPEVRHLGKSCRMLAVPYKKLLSSVDYLQQVMKDKNELDLEAPQRGGELKNSALIDIRDGLENILDEVQTFRKRVEKNINKNEKILRRIDKKLDSELEDDDEDDEKLKKTLRNYMIEQRRLLEKHIAKILNSDRNDDDDDDESIVCDDSDENGSKSCEMEVKKKRKSNDDDDDDDTDDDENEDDDEDDDGEIVCDDSDENGSKSCEKETKKRKKTKTDDDEIVCEDGDENGSKSCEKEQKKAYSKGKKKSRRVKLDDFDDHDSDDDVKKVLKKRKKVRKSLKDIEMVAQEDGRDKLIADGPESAKQIDLQAPPPGVPEGTKKIPDVTP